MLAVIFPPWPFTKKSAAGYSVSGRRMDMVNEIGTRSDHCAWGKRKTEVCGGYVVTTSWDAHVKVKKSNLEFFY